MKKSIKYLLIMFIFASCESDFKGDLGLNDYVPEVVITGAVAPGTNPIIKVTMSSPILSNSQYSLVNNATVDLMTNDDNLQLSYIGDGNYTTNASITSGTNIELQVDVPGYGILNGEDRIPSQVIAHSFVKIDTFLVRNNSIVSHLSFIIDDNPDETNFYELILYQVLGDTVLILPLRSPNPSIENGGATDIIGSPSTEFIRKFIVSDRLFNGKEFLLDLDFLISIQDFPIQVYLKSVSPVYHDYILKSYQAENNRDNPFSEPIAVPGNIEGGLGIFGAYTLHEESL